MVKAIVEPDDAFGWFHLFVQAVWALPIGGGGKNHPKWRVPSQGKEYKGLCDSMTFRQQMVVQNPKKLEPPCFLLFGYTLSLDKIHCGGYTPVN